MADSPPISGDADVVPVSKTPEDGTTGEPAKQKVPRYYNPYQINPVIRGRSYASTVVSSQETMLESLRFLRRQLDKEDRELARVQKDIYQNIYPNKWTNYRLQQGRGEDED